MITETNYYKLFKEFSDLVMSEDFLTGFVSGISNSINLSMIFPNILLRWNNNEPQENLQFYENEIVKLKARYASLSFEKIKEINDNGLFGFCLMIYSEIHLKIPMITTMKELKIPKWEFKNFIPLTSCSLIPGYIPKLNKALQRNTKLVDEDVINVLNKVQEFSVDDFLINTYSNFINPLNLFDSLSEIINSKDESFKWQTILIAKTILKQEYFYEDLLCLLNVPFKKYQKSLKNFESNGYSDFDIIFKSEEIKFFFNNIIFFPNLKCFMALSQEQAIKKILNDNNIDETSQLLFFDDDVKQKIKANNALIFDVLMNCPVVKYTYLKKSIEVVCKDTSEDNINDFKL